MSGAQQVLAILGILSAIVAVAATLTARRAVSQPAVVFARRATGISPLRATRQSAGWDLFMPMSPLTVVVKSGETVVVDVGVTMRLPRGHVGLVVGRSGFGARGLVNPLGVGVIDEDYPDTLRVVLRNQSGVDIELPSGTRIAQVLVLRLADVRSIGAGVRPATRRGGLGSTGEG